LLAGSILVEACEMADYEDIRNFFDQSDDLQSIARRAAKIPIVTGFVLDLDSSWAIAFDRSNNLIAIPEPRRTEYEIDGRFLSDRIVGYRRRDLNATLPQWNSYAESYQKNHGKKLLPIVLNIIHRPLRGGAKEKDDMEWLQQLVVIVREASIAVRIEERPRARLALASGDKITVHGTKTGTMGGVLDDKATGISYGVTCGHVAQTNDTVYDSARNLIGTCIADTPLAPLNAPQVCDPVTLTQPNPIPSNGPSLNMLDVGLIKLKSTVARTAISGIAGLSTGQWVKLGTTHHWLGSLAISYGFSDGTQNFCFRDSIELIPRPTGFFGGATVPTQGDSGGWVLTDDNPPDWVGIFFGEDGKRGFLIRAKWAHDWAEQVIGANLTL
jgi:hypothetical protein